jgi:hypothetical protein
MSVDLSIPANRYRVETEVWARGYSHVLYSLFVMKVDATKHLILANVVVGTHSQLASFSEMNYETEKLQVFRVLKSLGDRNFGHVLDGVLAGTVTVDDVVYSFEKVTQEFSIYSEELIFGDGKRKNAKLLHIHGPDYDSLFKIHAPKDLLDTVIKTGETPYDGLGELLTEAGLWETFRSRTGCHINITALTPATLMSTSFLSAGTFQLNISKSKVLDRTHIAVGYIVYKQGKSIERGRIQGPDLQWLNETETDGYEIGRFEKAFPGAVSAMVFLSYGDTIYDEWQIEDEQAEVNTLAAVYGVYDGARSVLIQHLNGKGKNPGRDFEAAFHNLLALCGFSSVHLGSIQGMHDRDSVDAIASTRSGRLLIIECTVGDINNDNKLGKLDARYKHILGQLETARVPIKASQRVIATSYTREQVKANLEDAGKLDIAVVTQDEVQEILDHLDGDVTSERLFDFIRRLVPDVRRPREQDLSDILGVYSGRPYTLF